MRGQSFLVLSKNGSEEKAVLGEPEGGEVFRHVYMEQGKGMGARTQRGMSSSLVILWLWSQASRSGVEGNEWPWAASWG